MKKTFKFLSIAMLGASLAFTACEKEETMNNRQIVATARQTEMDALLREAYAFAHNDNPTTITVPTSEAAAYRDRCFELFGGSVSIALHENDITTHITLFANHTAMAKKIWQNALDTKAAHFSSKDKVEMDNWKNQMKKEGYYKIIVTLDEKTGTYHGVAYTEEEWGKLNQ